MDVIFPETAVGFPIGLAIYGPTREVTQERIDNADLQLIQLLLQQAVPGSPTERLITLLTHGPEVEKWRRLLRRKLYFEDNLEIACSGIHDNPRLVQFLVQRGPRGARKVGGRTGTSYA